MAAPAPGIRIAFLPYTPRQLRRPIFTAVHGMAYGGGCEIAISTDFILASEEAVFGQPEAIVGLSAGGGSPVFLRVFSLRGKPSEMLMTGEPITARRRTGLVWSTRSTPGRADGCGAGYRGEDRGQLAYGGTVGQAVCSNGAGRNCRTGSRHRDKISTGARPFIATASRGIRAFTEGRETEYPDPDF